MARKRNRASRLRRSSRIQALHKTQTVRRSSRIQALRKTQTVSAERGCCQSHHRRGRSRGQRAGKPRRRRKASTKPKLEFMALPPEIRTIIYGHILTTSTTIRIPPCSCDKPEVETEGRLELHTSILRSNNLIRNEATYVLYGRNTFAMCCSRDGNFPGKPWLRLIRWLKTIGPRNSFFLRDLRIYQDLFIADGQVTQQLLQTIKLLGRNHGCRRTLTVELKEDFIPGVTYRLWTPDYMQDRTFRVVPSCIDFMSRMVTMDLPKRAERCRKDIFGPHAIEFFWEVRVRGAPAELDDYIARQGWRIVERNDIEQPLVGSSPAVASYALQIY